MVLFVHLPGGIWNVGESHGHDLAEPKDRVVCPCGVDRFDSKVCPPWKLCCKQTAHESYINGYLIKMHFTIGHIYLRLSIS